MCGVGGMEKGNEKDEEEDDEDEEEEEKEEREEDRLDWSCWDPAGEAELAARGDIKTLQQRAQDVIDLLPGVLGRRKEVTIAVVCHWGVINRLTGLSVDNGEVAVCTLSCGGARKGGGCGSWRWSRPLSRRMGNLLKSSTHNQPVSSP